MESLEIGEGVLGNMVAEEKTRAWETLTLRNRQRERFGKRRGFGKKNGETLERERERERERGRARFQAQYEAFWGSLYWNEMTKVPPKGYGNVQAAICGFFFFFLTFLVATKNGVQIKRRRWVTKPFLEVDKWGDHGLFWFTPCLERCFIEGKKNFAIWIFNRNVHIS